MENTKLRELTEEELLLVSGGCRSCGDEWLVHVTGTPDPDPYPGSPNFPSEPGDTTDEPWDPNQGGGDDPNCTCQQGSLDQQSDSAAGRIAGAIVSNSLSGFDWAKHEAGAIIYRDTTGQTQITALRTDYSSSGLTLDYAAYGLSASQVIGVVHNHPKVNDASLQQSFINNYNISITVSQAAVINGHPSDQDWLHAQTLVNSGANASELTVYIVDSGGMIREYQYADMVKWKADMENFKLPGTGVDNNVDCPLH